MNFQELLEKQAALYKDKPCLIFQGSLLSFQQLKESAFKIASGLADLGVRKQDAIAVYLPNIPEYILSFLGVFLLRGICVPLDFMLTEEEITNFINHSQSSLLIAQEKKGIDFNAVSHNCPTLKKIVLIAESLPAGFVGWDTLLAHQTSLPSVEANPEDYSSIFYTSGSTGHPKGVLLSYEHLSNPIKVVEYFLHPTDQDSFLCAGVPFSHIGGLDYMLFMFYFGTTLVLMERFLPLEFLKNIEKYRISIFCIVPSMYVALLSLKEYDKLDLSSLKYAVVFGAPSSPVLLERFHKACPNAYLLNGWGMTETSAPNAYLPTGTNAKEIPQTGKFMPQTEAKLVDEEGNALADEERGELWLRSRAVMVGYYREPELTKEALTADGWLKTGDIALRDKRGRYSIVGRKKEMLKVSGEIVFCPEVEEIIQRHPKVKEVGVIGVSDRLRGEVPKAFVVAKDGERLTEDELRYFSRQHLAHFKIPHYFEFRENLPKNRMGKLDKEALKRL